MATKTEIAWTHSTFNPWMGCTKVHAGCTHCYAESFTKRYNKAAWGPQGTRVKTSDKNWREPRKWNRAAEKAGELRRVFCASLADVFEDWNGPIMDHYGQPANKCEKCGTVGSVVYRDCWENGEPTHFCRLASGGCGHEQLPVKAGMDDLRRELFKIIDDTSYLDWLLLTKRPENVRQMWAERGDWWRNFPEHLDKSPDYRANVWLGTSISDQATADEWIPRLLECRDLCPVLFLSAEPLLGPIKMLPLDGIDWVIIGGESGHGSRECNIAWIRSIIRQCHAADVPVFCKQLGSRLTVPNDSCMEWPRQGDEWVYSDNPDEPIWQGKPITLHMDKKGGDWSEWPDDLRIRQFPEAR